MGVLLRSDLGTPAGLQFAAGVLGAALAFLFTCPAVGAAGLAALGDGWRYAGDSPAPAWRGAFGVAAAIAAASVAFPFFVPHLVSGWAMLGFGLFGIAVNAAAVFAAIPHRLSALHPSGVRASDAAYGATAVAGAIALARPEGWLCALAVAATALVLGLERARRVPA
jgi:hypothetical protein